MISREFALLMLSGLQAVPSVQQNLQDRELVFSFDVLRNAYLAVSYCTVVVCVYPTKLEQ